MNNEEYASAYKRLIGQGYTEEQIQSILGLSGLGSELDEISKQQEYVNTLRNPSMPEGRQVTSRVYTASNPLEQIGTVMQAYGAERDTRANEARNREIWDEQVRRRLEYLKRAKQGEPSVAPTQIPGNVPVPGKYQGGMV